MSDSRNYIGYQAVIRMLNKGESKQAKERINTVQKRINRPLTTLKNKLRGRISEEEFQFLFDEKASDG